MGAMMSVVKTLVVPAVISLLLYVLTSHVLLPLWRAYRQRYAQYLPLSTLDGARTGLSERTAGFRHRVSGAVGRFFSGAASSSSGTQGSAPDPSSWRARIFGLGGWDRGRGGVAVAGEGDDDGDDDGWDEEEGEELESVLYAGAPAAARPGRGGIDSERRLSRELEEGFMDDSDEENEVTSRPGAR